jgi:leucyl-tRNA synthetase
MACEDEPFKKMINQGKIQGRSSIVYRKNGTNTFLSKGLVDGHDVTPIHVDINIVDNDILDVDAFRAWRPELADAKFELEGGHYICGWEIEKMSKSLYNVQNPDELIEKYGADTFRLYEMFLGPLEHHKPWDIKGIEGVSRFMKKFWRLFFDEDGNFSVSDDKPNRDELKVIHGTIKKIKDDIEKFSFNTGVSNFMICVNKLHDLKCNKRAILSDLVVLISSYAPHIAEELWQGLGNTGSVAFASFPEYNEEYLMESTFEYPVSFNGKLRFKMEFPLDTPKEEIEKQVLHSEAAQKWIEGKKIRKVIVVPRKIINIVVG